MSTRVLVPDHPAFRALDVEGVQLVPFVRGHDVPEDVVGAVLWGFPRELRGTLFRVPTLRWVLTLTAGVDHLIHELPDGVQLYNASRLHDDAVAQHALATLLAAARGLHRARDLQRRGTWGRMSDLWTLQDRHVVIWGHGHIGRRLEAMLAPLGATVTGLRSSSDAAERDAALARADVLVLLLPETEATRGIVNAPVLAKLPAHAWLANFGRGSLVVTGDLVGALRDGHLGGAILDVTDPEPLPEDSPLWEMDNVLLTPHVASATQDVLARGAAFTNDFLRAMRQGGDLGNRVDRDRGY